MKQLSAIITIILLALAGCRQGSVDSPRLVELDSLIAVAPDSAAALLAAYPDDSLRTDDDRAYHALLLTQAKYKAYIPATSDSLINQAVAHYVTDDRGDYDRHIRALIYKGCVMTELGQPDSAMYWFKRAETAARPDDHSNLGYINYRMGKLSLNELKYDDTVITYFTKALGHYKHLPVSEEAVSTTMGIAAMYSVHDLDKSLEYYRQAYEMSQSLSNKKFAAQVLEQLSLTALQDSNFNAAKGYALQAIAMSSKTINAYTYASVAFSGLHKIDSAKMYLLLMPAPETRIDSLSYHRAYAEYARACNNLDSYVLHNDSAGYIADAIYFDSQQEELMEIEQRFTNDILHERLKTTSLRMQLILALSALIAIVAFSLAARLRKQSQKRYLAELHLEQSIRQLHEINQAYTQLEDEMSGMLMRKEYEINQMHNVLATKENDISEKEASLLNVSNRVKCLDEIIKQLYELKDNNNKTRFRSIKLSDSFWENLQLFVKQHYGKILDNHDLTEKEIRILSLYCINIPLEVIALILNLLPKTIYNYRPTIARKITSNQTNNLEDAIAFFKD